MKKYKDKEWLNKQYGEKGRTQQDIANECEVSRTAITKWVNNFGIEKKTKKELAKESPLRWSQDIAYLAGLITSDGNLRKKEPRIGFYSGDYSLMLQAKEIAENNLNINSCTPYQKDNGVWQYEFTNRRFYYLLENMGLMPNKSKKLGKLKVPDNMFYDWLRGEVDGDGCVGIYNGYLQLGIYSGSKEFLQWISQELKKYDLVKGKGNVNEHKGAYQLRFANQDSSSIAKAIYDDAHYYLRRKYEVVREFI